MVAFYHWRAANVTLEIKECKLCWPANSTRNGRGQPFPTNYSSVRRLALRWHGWIGSLKRSKKIYDETYDDSAFHEPFGRVCCVSYFLNTPWEQDRLVEILCIGLKYLIARDGVENVKASDWRAVPIFSFPDLR